MTDTGSPLSRLKADLAASRGIGTAAVYTADLALALAVIRAAEAVHDSGHNGNLYAREYNQLTAALDALTVKE